MVLMRVDFPRPVWPIEPGQSSPVHPGHAELTDADDIELESSLQQLLLDLLRDAIKTNMASREDSIPLRHGHGHLGRRRLSVSDRGVQRTTGLSRNTRRRKLMSVVVHKEVAATADKSPNSPEAST